MRISSNLMIASVCFVATIGLLALTFTHKHHKPAEAPAAPSDSNFTNYIETIEKQNSLDRDAKEEADKLAKQVKAKKESVECQFWTRQNASNPSARAAEKISQFCEVSSSAESTASSADAEATKPKP